MANAVFFRKRYPEFVYEGYSWKVSGMDLRVSFDFHSGPDIYFKPEITIKDIDEGRIKSLGVRALDNIIFHLGMIELLSYWKSVCSPEIVIKAGNLNKFQIKWWKNLLVEGMGQFFYENRIDWRESNFLTIKCSGSDFSGLVSEKLKNRVLVPVSGGKDSAITLEILKNAKKETGCFSLNLIEAAQKIMELGGCKKPLIVERKIDKRLLELNRQGYLNGHTPFSAYLAFLSVLLAIIFDYKRVAFSQERSSNEGNVRYLGKTINHQWSKSFEFENLFRSYSKRYLSKDVEYFSFLRPLYEIQIAEIFSKYPKYFPAFLSCNEAQKTDSGAKKPAGKWCGKCPKCLFVFGILYPFVGEGELLKIFGQNLFEKKELLPLMLQLVGEKGFKPFECVGTKEECLIAFYLSWKKAEKSGKKPFMLRYFEDKILSRYPKLEKESERIMNGWSGKNNLPSTLKTLLKGYF